MNSLLKNILVKAGIKVGPDCGLGRIRSDQVGLGRTKSDSVGSLENLEISGYSGKCYLHKWKFAFFPALFTHRETTASQNSVENLQNGWRHFMLLDF
jgi:hypothetical protein